MAPFNFGKKATPAAAAAAATATATQEATSGVPDTPAATAAPAAGAQTGTDSTPAAAPAPSSTDLSVDGQRVAEIYEAGASCGQLAAAKILAADPAVSAATATAVFEAVGTNVASPSSNSFMAAMNTEGSPDIGGGSDDTPNSAFNFAEYTKQKMQASQN